MTVKSTVPVFTSDVLLRQVTAGKEDSWDLPSFENEEIVDTIQVVIPEELVKYLVYEDATRKMVFNGGAGS